MARPSISDRLCGQVSEHLEGAIRIFEDTGVVSVPVNRSGSINVSKLIEAWNLGKSDRQHLYRPEVAGLINAACARLQIGGIATGSEADEEEREIRSRVTRVAAQARNDARAAVEAKSEVSGLLDRIRDLERDKALLQMRVNSLEEQIALVHQGVLVRI